MQRSFLSIQLGVYLCPAGRMRPQRDLPASASQCWPERHVPPCSPPSRLRVALVGVRLFFISRRCFLWECWGDEKPSLFRWRESPVLPCSWSRISRMSCQFAQGWLRSSSRCMCWELCETLEEVQEQILGLWWEWPSSWKILNLTWLPACINQIAVICGRSLF